MLVCDTRHGGDWYPLQPKTPPSSSNHGPCKDTHETLMAARHAGAGPGASMCFWKGLPAFLPNQYLFTNLFVCLCRCKLSRVGFLSLSACVALFPLCVFGGGRWREGLRSFAGSGRSSCRSPRGFAAVLCGGTGRQLLRPGTSGSPRTPGPEVPMLLRLEGLSFADGVFP